MHTIRLRGPFEVSSASPNRRKVKRPADWAGLEVVPGEPVTVGRRFNAPSGLGPDQTIYVALISAQLPLTVTLNDALLGGVKPASCPVHFEITALLEPRNLLQIEFAPDQECWPPSGDPFELQLEITDVVD